MDTIKKQLNPSFPKIIQIELSTFCNFHCKMCVRNNWTESMHHFPLETFRKLAESSFKHVDRIIFMGIGEILTHPKFLDILKITADNLSEEAGIEFTTNGALLKPELADKIFKIAGHKLERIIVSLDSPFMTKLQRVRPEADENLIENIKYLANKRKNGAFKTLGIESVLMKSNIYDLKDLILFASKIGVNAIYLTHLLPHTPEMESEVIYSTISRELWDLGKDFINKSWEILEEGIISKALKPAFGVFENEDIYLGKNLLNQLEEFNQECDKNNIDINFSKLIMTFKRSQILSDAETLLKEAKELADKKGIFLETPPIFPELKKRRCPYIERDAAVINVHGDVIPCYNYIHDSVSYIDGNMRSESKVSFGNINTSDLKTIWNSQKYMDFRTMLKGDNFNKNIPYCGDCPYVMANCFYTKNNESDCYGNKPGCNQCLYSYNLIKCIFDK